MGRMIFNYKGKKYTIQFYNGIKYRGCIVSEVVFYHGEYVSHKSRLFYFNEKTRLKDILRAI